MPNLIVLRLLPEKAVKADEFTKYLTGLSITVSDIAFGNLNGNVLGTATYDADPAHRRIFQHVGINPMGGGPIFKAIATALIEVPSPPTPPEYGLSDLLLTIRRNNKTIITHTVNYNATVDPLVPSVNPFDLEASAYVTLPSPKIGLDPNIAYVELSADGTPPKFEDLKTAVLTVLSKDPGGSVDLKTLKPNAKQCLLIANEIIWNRDLYPLPTPPRALEEMYTGPHKDSDSEEQDRKKFEGDLLSYYSTHNAEAERLSKFVFALVAAIQCEDKSTKAERVGFKFPVVAAPVSNSAKINQAELILTQAQAGGLDPVFKVPAEYFYALGTSMPPQITVEQRYQIAILEDEPRLQNELEIALDNGVITEPTVKLWQAIRRLRALGTAGDAAPECALTADLHPLVQDWLDWQTKEMDAFWTNEIGKEAPAHLIGKEAPAHLKLVLYALTEGYQPLIAAIMQPPPPPPPLSVTSAAQLAALTVQQWHDLFFPPPTPGKPPLAPRLDLLPPFTSPGSAEERVAAFVRRLRKFFDVSTGTKGPDSQSPDAPPQLNQADWDPFQEFITAYNNNNAKQAAGDPDFKFGQAWNETYFSEALSDSHVFPNDTTARAWLDQALRTIDALYTLTDIFQDSNNPDRPELRFSIAEALYARGFTCLEDVQGLTQQDFQEALTGTIAYDHASKIYSKAQPTGPASDGRSHTFRPINPGCLVDCIPPLYLSPLGPIAYLQEMLRVSSLSTCEVPFPKTGDGQSLADALAQRRGPVGALHVTRANLEMPLPLIDMVNECLETLAAGTTASAGAVYDTSTDSLAGHTLCSDGGDWDPAKDRDEDCHNPAALFAALPEHSSPAALVAQPTAYEQLRKDFSAPLLPYSQPLDISRSYLRQLDTSRYAVMRRFRKDITEFVLDPVGEPADFQRSLWRYPVRIEIAIEYLGITPEEYRLLYAQGIAMKGQPLLWELYGFEANYVGKKPWTQVVVIVSEFLKRTGLTYCEFLELQQAEFVKFRRVGEIDTFPDCEPCYLDQYTIQFVDPKGVNEALGRLAVFIRLWRKLREVGGARYTFAQLRDICDVLHLFNNGAINLDFIRQLAAFQMLRDHLGLRLTDGSAVQPGDTGADRTHLLALWIGENADKWEWAVGHLLDRVQHYAQARHKRGHRSPEFLKLIAENLDPLSRLAGFDPGSPGDTWHALPTHVLRFAEVLSKIYASNFSVGEILFLFTVSNHLDGDDPFPLADENETLDEPLDLPDDQDEYSLWALRRELREVHVSEEEAAEWTWPRIEASLRDEFGFVVPAGEHDPLLSLAEHFFPGVLETCGCPVDVRQRQYRIDLANTTALMWNTPTDGPFRYDAGAHELWTQLPLLDEAVCTKLSRMRPLAKDEQQAVQDLYFKPRVDLAPFAFIFTHFARAEEHLIQEADEAKRWAYFRREFAGCYRRCRLIAEHLVRHVAAVTDQEYREGADLAWCLLQHLFADENRAKTPWEVDDGSVPAVTWQHQPNGGAFAALLGLLGEYTPEGEKLNWREVRGPLSAFGQEKNDWNAPVPTVLPSTNLTLTPAQERFFGVRNGFALRDENGAQLGGAQGFGVRWSGVLLIESEGTYEFRAGAPTSDGEEPDFERAEQHRWRVTLKRGQKTWILFSHRWPGARVHSACSASLPLKRGAYQLTVEFAQPRPTPTQTEDMCPQYTGFQVKYAGPDSADRLVAIPLEHLFRDVKDVPLDDQLDLTGEAAHFLALHFTSSLRDIRRTYQRAFKALLFAQRFDLSAKPIANYGQSEIGYMLTHASNFAGTSYYRQGDGFSAHRANFDFNFLPLLDPHPASAQDLRTQPSLQRQQALFDWWERTFDYVQLRRETRPAGEHPVWLLFDEATEKQPDDPAHLLRHMSIDLRHADLALRYCQGYTVTSAELEDERWPERVWRVEMWLRELLSHFAVKDIHAARPDLWAADDPSMTEAGESQDGNANLTQFVRDGCIENGATRRYEDIRRLNNSLRERARQALLAYLCGMNRIQLPWGYAQVPEDLSAWLLLDVEAGIGEKASRVEEAITAVQSYVQRSRLGLEPGFNASPEFVRLWDRCFATFSIWEARRRREIYRENWIEWDEIQQAERTEAFRFLEAELRRTTLTIPEPGGLEYWPGQPSPVHSGLAQHQRREPALMRQLSQPREGLKLLGTPGRDARLSWLTALRRESNEGGGSKDTGPIPSVRTFEQGNGHQTDHSTLSGGAQSKLPLWIQAAIRLGTRFIRVAAAAEPPAATHFAPWRPEQATSGCAECGREHPIAIDEYYFWLIDTRYYRETGQDANWLTQANASKPEQSQYESDWHDSNQLPKLLAWKSAPMVHLVWCRVHNGEFQQPRRSFEGVRITTNNSQPDLTFLGRAGDSLNFMVQGGVVPQGYLEASLPGFRYDIATDTAVVLPLIETDPNAKTDSNAAKPTYPGDLTSYPFFAYFTPGARLVPPSLFGPALAAASTLRAHCRFEAALKWYEMAFDPLQEDCSWIPCTQEQLAKPGNYPDALCCASSPVPDQVALERSITLHYLETLLQWGNALLCHRSPEAFQRSRLIFDTAERILGARPRTVVAEDSIMEPPMVTHFVARCAPLNPRLLALYDLVDDRQAQIHDCLNARRLRNGRIRPDKSYWGSPELRNDWQSAVQVCEEEEEWCSAPSPYRFLFLLQKAQELANGVRELGAALLAAFEKGDAEYLASLRATHERQLLHLALEVRQNQWRAADWQVQALQKTKEGAQTRKRYFENLILLSLISGETQYETLTYTAIGLQAVEVISELIGQLMNFSPDPYVGTVNFAKLPVGSKLATVFSTAARMSGVLAGTASTIASLRLTQAGWDRRDAEWRHQVDVIDLEIEQIERQFLASERQRDIALRELNNHQRQMEHAAEVQDFMRDKFTNHALLLWLQQETTALYARMYELALHTARQAQQAFNYERGHTVRRFLPNEVWDNLHEGLLAGERLQFSLRHMEKAYLDENVREYELTKHFSLRLHFPMEFLRLKATGCCEIEIPEWMLDLDYPGHYMRRIRNISLTIPCVVGPYTGVHCRLTLQRNTTRVHPRLRDPLVSCCDGDEFDNGYRAVSDDSRIVTQYAATEAIATSGGQNDSGLFELNFRDERYLPFEFMGAVSRWRIELPQENNRFDIDTLSDVILHLNYTAREGGEVLRRAANEVAQHNLPGAGLRFYDVKYEFPDAWHRFQGILANERSERQLGLRLGRDMFPFIPGHRDLWINRLELFFEASGADQSAHQIVKFVVGHRGGRNDQDECEVFEICCITSAEWPGYYHGVLDIRLGPLSQKGDHDLGTFSFPHDTGEVSRAFLFCGYNVTQMQSEMRRVRP